MDNQPAPHARPSSVHQRLTVALANAADRARLAEAIAGTSTDAPVPLLRSEDLWLAADRLAQARAEDRRALRARLDAVAARMMHDCDTGRHQLEHLETWQRTIMEGADWATKLHEDLPEHLDAVEAVRAALDERRAEQRAAQQDLERVLEQRMAAAGAIEEADRELAEMAGSGMDESGLRRELEAAGQAVQDAAAAHDQAQAKLEELQLEASGLEIRRETTEVPGDVATGGTEQAEVEAVRAALAEAHAVSIAGLADQTAVALAQAWRDLNADLRQVAGPLQSATEQELDAARRRVLNAAATLSVLDAAAQGSTISPDERAALDAAHAEVLAAEENVLRRRRVSDGARRRLEAAHAAERTLLDRHGFGGYLDVVLSGGRSAVADPARAAAERAHFEATLALEALEALERNTQSSPELRHLRSERIRLLGLTVDLLGVDPGDNMDALLASHRPVSPGVQAELVRALDAVGIRPVGVSLEDAATAFLAEHPVAGPMESSLDVFPADERRIELAAIDARSAALEGELVSAEAEVARTAEDLQLAQRSVGAFEGELTVRAGEDMQRMKRFAGAEQLRAQIEAVAGTLRRAEEGARRAVEAADQAVAGAVSTFEQSASEISDLARRARKLAEELPIDDRPQGDPLRTLVELSENLRAHAGVLQPEIDKAEAAVTASSDQLEEAMAACRLAGTGGDGPRPEDLAEGLAQLLGDEAACDLLVLDEPFAGVDDVVRDGLLEIVRTASSDCPMVLLTDDAEILGWAIELPADEATAVPAEALLTRIRRANVTLNLATPDADAKAPTVADPGAAPTHDAAPPAVDITTPTTIDTDQEAPTVRRWAGQR